MSRIRVKAGGKSVFSSQRMLALCTLLVLFAFFSVFGKRFFSADTMMNLIESSYYIICMALGMTFIIATGGIDLSIGTVGMCGAIVGGVAYNVWGLPMWCALLFIVVTTTLFGALNGFLVAYCKLPAFVATMGVMMISQGVGYIVSEVQTMRFPIISLDGFPMGIIYVVILFLIAAFLLRYTKLGKYACAIGSNKEATRLSGVNTKKWEMLVYVVSGVFTGFAGLFYAATYTSVLPGSGAGMEMQAVAAVVIGGTSLAGGFGTIVGTLIGVFIMSVLKNGLMTVGLQQQWQVFFTGIAVLLAVLLDIYKTGKDGRAKG